MSMLASIRRHATVIAVFLTCTVTVLYSYGGWTSFEDDSHINRGSEINVNSKEQSHAELPARNIAVTQIKQHFRKFSNGKRTQTIQWETTKRQRKTTTLYQLATRLSSAQPTQLARKKSEIRDEWSKSWPQVNIGDCSHIEYMNRGLNSKYQVEAQSFPTTGLISFPGSGNTWTRHLIQQATGLWTGSVYKDESLYNGGFRAELDDCNDKGSIAIKAHYPIVGAQSYCKFDRAIIVVRDPYRAVLSEFNWRMTSKHTGVADLRLFQTNTWKQHAIRRTEKWLSTTQIWIERFYTNSPDRSFKDEENPFLRNPASSNTLLLVSYERMKENPAREMERIVRFLQLKIFRRNCVQTGEEGNFRRKSTKSESIDCLFEKFELKATLEAKIRTLAARTMELGLGDVTSEFEGPGGDVVSEKCRHV